MARAVLQGVSVSSGVCIGQAFFYNKKPDAAPHILISGDMVGGEVARFNRAVSAVIEDLEQAKANLPDHLSDHRGIIDSHLLMCLDHKLKGETERYITAYHMNAEWALDESVEIISASFRQISVPYIREKLEDVRLVSEKIMNKLLGVQHVLPETAQEGVLFAYDISPLDALSLANTAVSAFVSEQGGATAHIGIVARNLRIPAIVGASGIDSSLSTADMVIVDGFTGRVLVGPTEAEIEEYTKKTEYFSIFQNEMQKGAHFPAETTDGRRFSVLANIDLSNEVDVILENGGEGSGLIRTEFSLLKAGAVPSEEVLFEEYKHLSSALAPYKTVFRTFDVGADKIFSDIPLLDESNPAMGMRSIRYCLRHQGLFRRQLRAILKASAYGAVEIMFPLIANVTELHQAKALLDEARQELEAEKIPFKADIPVGIMIELPAAVQMADILAREADFFSIGTNDLIQFMLGVDRDNRHVAHLYQPMNPAVIRAIKSVTDMAHEAGIAVSVCGEMAAEPYCIPLLLGMPVDALSVSAHSIPFVKRIIRNNSIIDCRNLLADALRCSSTSDVRHLMVQYAYVHYPDDVPFFTSLSGIDC